ncbi:hypothetical protein ACLOJK_028563 [Asimina triloba]
MSSIGRWVLLWTVEMDIFGSPDDNGFVLAVEGAVTARRRSREVLPVSPLATLPGEPDRPSDGLRRSATVKDDRRPFVSMSASRCPALLLSIVHRRDSSLSPRRPPRRRMGFWGGDYRLPSSGRAAAVVSIRATAVVRATISSPPCRYRILFAWEEDLAGSYGCLPREEGGAPKFWCSGSAL